MAASTRIIDYLGGGLAVDRPVSLTLPSGGCGLYYATDTNQLSLWDGTDWFSINVLDGMVDVDTTTTPPAEGNVLVFRTDKFVPEAPTGGGVALTPPLAADFPTWYQQNGATATDSDEGMLLFTAGFDPNVDTHIGLCKAYPATPWTITVKIKTLIPRADFNSAGMILRDSVNDKNVFFQFAHASGLQLYVTYYNGDTFASHAGTVPIVNEELWMQVEDDGTNLTFRYGLDGVTWQDLASVGRTAFMAVPDLVGFFANPESIPGVGVLVQHYVES